MFRKPFHALLNWFVCLLLTGCGGVSVSVLLFDEFLHDSVRPLVFQEVSPVLASAIDDRRFIVVRDLGAWDSLWREHTSDLMLAPSLPPINFSQQMVIGIFPGISNYPCIKFEIQSVWEHTYPARIEVNYREERYLADANGQCPEGIYNSPALVTLAYSYLPVEFFQVR